MTEKQKRDNGELYYAGKDSDFLDEVIKAKDLCYEYNQIRPTDFKAQREILEKLLGKIGEDSVIYPPFSGAIMVTTSRWEKAAWPIMA